MVSWLTPGAIRPPKDTSRYNKGKSKGEGASRRSKTGESLVVVSRRVMKGDSIRPEEEEGGKGGEGGGGERRSRNRPRGRGRWGGQEGAGRREGRG